MEKLNNVMNKNINNSIDDRIKKIVRESLKKIVEERWYSDSDTSLLIDQPSQSNEKQQLLEMARINKNETNIFPYNKWEVRIWSNDHNPPHFHVVCDGWNISFCIEDGSLLNIDSQGSKESVKKYMLVNVKTWLEEKCVVQPKLTNKENAILQWEQLHDR